MSTKSYCLWTGILFAIIFLVHLYRIAAGIPISIGSSAIPMWPSWIGLAVAGFFAYQGLRLGSKS
jgi:hypothetical protein